MKRVFIGAHCFGRGAPGRIATAGEMAPIKPAAEFTIERLAGDIATVDTAVFIPAVAFREQRRLSTAAVNIDVARTINIGGCEKGQLPPCAHDQREVLIIQRGFCTAEPITQRCDFTGAWRDNPGDINMRDLQKARLITVAISVIFIVCSGTGQHLF
ncbi:hypothetical protein NS226_23740, partial [Aureimonas ureilytica]